MQAATGPRGFCASSSLASAIATESPGLALAHQPRRTHRRIISAARRMIIFDMVLDIL